MKNYNERLAEIMMGKDDKTYRETAEAIRRSDIDIYGYYQEHKKRIPRLFDPNVNINAMKKGLKQLEKELSDKGLNEKKIDLSSLMLAGIISDNLV